ncbi:MAG: hypothetical protein COX81_03935 [Candidatus Magasanikbacteria bacterium CG_4_10_14_0_2_um_filter_37_12]|uniref:Leucine--tRNA ligase n=1 Tax=Candidatus Magasanikbacteria bacterium CG_4_10_14_0_2_um_filter_37_12 TaxID=1974637 RepID=A0A2M7V6Q2_9BACT|nr:MAG: hypothetical protein COX81_03935 [Candidatus Magasanikbacteria bacterium CG_4_10_14_0_2_um_filter_37_12]
MENYNPKLIEAKWQKHWEEHKTFATPEDVTPENKCYILPQLPYPSGSGLHVGHAEVYTACDIYARYQRMKGKKVLQVFGLDSFGLPAENYAIKTNVHPQETIDKTTENFVSQVKALGVSVDWDRFVRSSDPGYYKFTQWFFLLMYERGLAYRKKQAVNWCESCKTVLANAQVVDGHCERCDTVVIQKEMEQWYLKITDYADKLLEGLDRIDWPAETIKRQKDWIGRSEGALIQFNVYEVGESADIRNTKSTKLRNVIEVFTTRPDTLFGATYMVLAPEGQYVQDLKDNITNWDEVEKYIEETSKKTDLDRQIEKDKTGVELKGVKAVNPANDEEIPIWIADYVIATYGTGAIMAVPAHDERDFEFAKKFGLPIREVVAKDIGDPLEGEEKSVGVYGLLERDGKVLVMYEKKNDLYRLPGGTQEENETDYETLKREFAEETGYINNMPGECKGQVGVHFLTTKSKELKHYIRKIFSVQLKNEEKVALYGEDKDIYEYIWMTREEAVSAFERNKTSNVYPHDTGEGLLVKYYFDGYDECVSEPGITINSDFLNGLTTEEAKTAIIDWLEKNGHGKRKVQYKLRDWSVSRQRFWGAPIPMLTSQKSIKSESQKFDELPDFVLNLHAWGSDPQSHFHPWISKELAEKHIVSITPLLPHPEHPKFNDWLEATQKELSKDTTNTVVTARSLSCWIALALAQTMEFRKLVLVAPSTPTKDWYIGFGREGWGDAEKEIALAFFGDKEDCLDFKKIRKNVGEIVIYLSTNDPYIPCDATKKYFEKYIPEARIIIERDAGHFDIEHGYNIFSSFLDEIMREVRPDLRPLPESDLPVILPDDVDFKPTGQSPLTYSPSFQDGVEEKYGKGWKREVDTLDTFMCSSWYFFRYLDPHNEKEFASPEALKKWMPVDFYLGGPEHVNGHLLYARFFTKVLYDAGYIDFDEPFTVHRHQGLILGPDGRKMSKRWENVINPTDVVNEFGADTMRMYEMFMGPMEEDKPWDENGVKGIKRFLDRVWNLQDRLSDNAKLDLELDRKLHHTIQKVGDDLSKLGFNTAIAKLMELVNEFYKQEKVLLTSYQSLVTLLAPFAPHISEELWSILGHKDSISLEAWSAYDEDKLTGDKLSMAVQVNGKVRASIVISIDATDDEVESMALAQPNVVKWLGGQEPKKVIYVKGRILNIVV